jgi:rhodanese-related sulfurtransferase
MPFPTEITVPQLSRLVGLPEAPAVVDVRSDDEFKADPRLIPTAQRHDSRDAASWAGLYAGRATIVVCRCGAQYSHGTASWLRHKGLDAQSLEGGFEAWKREGGVLVRADKVPLRNGEGRTVWVTRARPKVVRIACPWLVRRFVDPKAVFLFVPPSEVLAVAEHMQATPFDAPDAVWNDRGDKCTFDVMVEELGLATDALSRLAMIVRGADTGRLDLTPQSAGLLATSLGYSRMHRDDLAQLEAAMSLYDALYRWCRDATQEMHG